MKTHLFFSGVYVWRAGNESRLFASDDQAGAIQEKVEVGSQLALWSSRCFLLDLQVKKVPTPATIDRKSMIQAKVSI